MKKLIQYTLLALFMASLLITSCAEEALPDYADEPSEELINMDELNDTRLTDPEDSTYDPFDNN